MLNCNISNGISEVKTALHTTLDNVNFACYGTLCEVIMHLLPSVYVAFGQNSTLALKQLNEAAEFRQLVSL
jgi:hypothetical protein